MRRIEFGTAEGKNPGEPSCAIGPVMEKAGKGRVADMTGKTAAGWKAIFPSDTGPCVQDGLWVSSEEDPACLWHGG